jgi:hypothetical protein
MCPLPPSSSGATRLPMKSTGLPLVRKRVGVTVWSCSIAAPAPSALRACLFAHAGCDWAHATMSRISTAMVPCVSAATCSASAAAARRFPSRFAAGRMVQSATASCAPWRLLSRSSAAAASSASLSVVICHSHVLVDVRAFQSVVGNRRRKVHFPAEIIKEEIPGKHE